MNKASQSSIKARAFTKRVGISPHKVRKIVDQIRGCSCLKALLLLKFMPYRACSPIRQLVMSAVANASDKVGLSKADLLISEIQVDKGPVLKKMRPRAQGRGYPIRKTSCAITLIVSKRAQDVVMENLR